MQLIQSRRFQNLPEDDHRRTDPRFEEPELSGNFQLVKALEPIAKRSSRTLAQLALAWVLRQPQITSAIVGARRPSQIEETTLAGDRVLSNEDMSAIESLLHKRQRALNSI